MCTKVPRAKSVIAVSVRQEYIDGLTGRWKEPNSEIWKFIQTKKLSEQAAVVKKVGQALKGADDIRPVLDVLIDTYLQCPPKHQLKRAIASCLESVSTCQPCVEQAMQSHIINCLQITTSLTSCRAAIDNCNSLLENFPLGERCLQGIVMDALIFLSECLKLFYNESKTVNTPVALTEAMHNCHVTVQVWNKLVARTESFFRGNEKTIAVITLMAHYLNMAWKIILDENFLVDCRAACGMTLPLVFKVICREKLVEIVVRDLFPSSDVAKFYESKRPDFPFVTSPPALADPLVPAWPTTMVCVAGGCLAMLGTSHLATELGPGVFLLVDVIGRQLVNLIDKMFEVSSKVVLSRTLVLWTTKAVQTLAATSGPAHQRLSDRLRGEGEVPTALMEYAWTHWEDATDVIRHQARLIFDNLLECHLLATGEEPSNSAFLLRLLESLMSTGWQHRGRYGPLCCLVGHLGAAVILRQTPALPRHLLAAMGDQTLAGYVSELYEKLFSEHRLELCTASGDPGGHMTQWLVTWVDPLLQTLCEGSRLQRTHVIEYILPRLLKHSPDSLPYMTLKLTEGDTGGAKIGALVTCLKRAKMAGLLQRPELQAPEKSELQAQEKPELQAQEKPENQLEESDDSDLWCGVVSVDVLKMSLCHQNEQLRLEAFGLLVENPKTTETLTQVDLDLVIFFLPLNTSSQSPSFRQQLAALLKRLFVRLRDGAQSLRRKAKRGDQDAEMHIQQYSAFVKWFIKKQFESLYLGASFPCRTMALSALSTYTSIMLEQGTTNHKESCEFALSNYIRPEQVQTLLECLSDSFEQNKIDSYKVLTSLPYQTLHLQEETRLEALLRTGLSLASSTRPQDSTTAAYLLRVLLTQPTLLQVAPHVLRRRPDAADVTPPEGRWARHLVVLEILVEQLGRQLEVARRSLVHAAATEPLYPTLHCIRYLLNDVSLRDLSAAVRWRELLKSIIDISFQVALVVSPVVSNSSPEGNVPLGPGLALEAVVQGPEDAEALRGAAESARTVSLVPEYLVVCCWRSIKECSLLLGQLTLTAPLTDPNGDPATGLLSVSQLHELGDYFTTQLLESRHRGAFELAYAGFVKMTEMLWKCPFPEVQALPKQWLTEIMKDIKSRDPKNRLCATRRSAGVPFYVQAIVSAEPLTTGRVCFKQLMTELLELAVPTCTTLPTEDPAQVHALNVLRALYRDTRLGDDVFPYVTGGLKAAIIGYSSQLWAIRNSATLLFSALMTRIFGVKRSKDEMSKKNCLTGRVFFHRFPALYQFLLDQMEEGTSNIGSSGTYQLHPGLYPVLMVLARLYPSVVEGPNTTLNTVAFVPFVIRCASSPVYKTRLMAARAIRPLVGKDQITATLTSLLERLPSAPGGATSQNALHGVLLQVKALVESVGELPTSQAQELLIPLSTTLSASLWILNDDNPCLVTRKAFAELCFSVVELEFALPGPDPSPAAPAPLPGLWACVSRQAFGQLFAPARPPATPELSEYLQTLTRHLLRQASFRHQPPGDATSGETLDGASVDLVHLVVGALRSAVYEVRLEGLDFLAGVFPGEFVEEGCEADLNKMEGGNVQCLRGSPCLYRQLVTMVLSENNTECLTKTLELLCRHDMIHVLPWSDATMTSHDAFTIMLRLVECKAHASDDVRSAAHELSACLVPHLYEKAAQGSSAARETLRSWCEDLARRCATQESVCARLTAATSLMHNARCLLEDPHHVLGPDVYDVWTVVVRLLQDEDVDVRQVAARVVHGVMVSSNTDDADDVTRAAPQPLVALDWAASRVVALRAARDWRGVYDCLLTWILTDVEPEWLDQEEREVRLFDKGEMNTYRDEMLFVVMVAKHFSKFLQNTVHHDNQTTFDQNDGDHVTLQEDLYMRPNAQHAIQKLRQKLVRNKLKDLLAELRAKIASMKTVTASTPFLMASQYQEDIICICRLRLALTCLLSVAANPQEKKELIEKLSSAFDLRFSSADAVRNVLSSFGEESLDL